MTTPRWAQRDIQRTTALVEELCRLDMLLSGDVAIERTLDEIRDPRPNNRLAPLDPRTAARAAGLAGRLNAVLADLSCTIDALRTRLALASAVDGETWLRAQLTTLDAEEV